MHAGGVHSVQVLTDTLLSSRLAPILLNCCSILGKSRVLPVSFDFPLPCVRRTWAETLTAGALRTWACILDPLPAVLPRRSPLTFPTLSFLVCYLETTIAPTSKAEGMKAIVHVPWGSILILIHVMVFLPVFPLFF